MNIEFDAVEQKFLEAKAQLNGQWPDQFAKTEVAAMHEIIATRKRLLSSYLVDNVNQLKIQDINLYYRNLGSLIDDILQGYHLEW